MKMIVVGCGRVGSELAELLDAEGHYVTVVDPDPETFRRLGAAFRGRTVAGVGFDRDVLIDAGIKTADGLAAVFSDDAINLVVARVARDRFHVPVVVARLYDPHQAELYRDFSLQAVSSTSWGVQRLKQIITGSPLRYVASLGSGEVQVVELRVPSRLVGHPIRSLLAPDEVALVGLTRGGHTCIPSSDTLLEENDLLSLSASATAIGWLELALRQEG